MKQVIFLTALVCLLATSNSFACPSQELASYIDGAGLNGTVLVAQNGKILHYKAYGLKGGETLNRRSTTFNIASLTKQFTATGILMLADEGKLSLDDSITDYVPEIVNGNDVTIKNCLNHTSGLYEYLLNEQLWTRTSQAHTPDDLLSYFESEALSFEPGSNWEYCNSNYIVLGLIIERVSGQEYGHFLQANIFKPLRMRRTHYKLESTGHLAIGYDSIDPLTPSLELHSSIPYAAGGINGPIIDLYKWSQGYKYLLSHASREEMFTPNEWGYGYGWFVDSIYINEIEYEQHWHWGSSFGYGSYITQVEDISIIILENLTAQSAQRHAEISSEILALLL